MTLHREGKSRPFSPMRMSPNSTGGARHGPDSTSPDEPSQGGKVEPLLSKTLLTAPHHGAFRFVNEIFQRRGLAPSTGDPDTSNLLVPAKEYFNLVLISLPSQHVIMLRLAIERLDLTTAPNVFDSL